MARRSDTICRIGRIGEAAERKHEEFLSYLSSEGMLALYRGWTGIDFSQYDPSRSNRHEQPGPSSGWELVV